MHKSPFNAHILLSSLFVYNTNENVDVQWKKPALGYVISDMFNVDLPLQWGSELRAHPVFRSWRFVWLSNGLQFKWWSEYWIIIVRYSRGGLNTGPGIQIIITLGTGHLSIWGSLYQTNKILIFRCFQYSRGSNTEHVRISDGRRSSDFEWRSVFEWLNKMAANLSKLWLA